MQNIVILGNSAAGFSACDAFVRLGKDFSLTVISQEDTPAYRRDRLFDYLNGITPEKELFISSEEYYSQNKITFLKGAKAVRVDTKRHRVCLEDGIKISYDFLVLATGCKTSLPDITGKNKNGVMVFDTLKDAREIMGRMPLLSSVCLVGRADVCSGMASLFLNKGKEVKVVSGEKPETLQPYEKLEWIDNASLTEIIGEGSELKAFKLSNGKVIATALVIFAGEYLPETTYLKESAITRDEGFIIVDEHMRTNHEQIFACGTVCRRSGEPAHRKTWDEAVAEGHSVTAYIVSLSERGNESCQQMS
jgi:nitrite reductase (NADH) large subunit